MDNQYNKYEHETNQQPENTFESATSASNYPTADVTVPEANPYTGENTSQPERLFADGETAQEIDPIYQQEAPISPTPASATDNYHNNYHQPNPPYADGYARYQPNHPLQEEALHNQHTPHSPYFTGKPVADRENIGYQQIKEKRQKKGHAFRNFVACLLFLGALYGTYTFATYQAEEKLDRKLSEIRTELESAKVSQSEMAAAIQTAQSTSQDNKTATAHTTVGTTSVSPVVAIADRVAPSVVTITATISSRSNHSFFESYPHTYKGSGSGILYKKDNDSLYVITNHHVIENAKDIKVTFHDEQSSPAEVIGYDSRNDLAVLKINWENVKNKNVTLATFGDSTKLKVGQLAVAIGNPLGEGHDHTITAGVISSVNRSLDIENIKDLEVIQTDAAINPGNSGGALVNEYSEVIGINTAKYLDVKVEGMGFAIPSSVAIPVIEKILKNGNGDAAYAISDDRPFLGIGFSGITSDIYAKTGVPFGVYVTKVYEGSAAANAGVEEGDILFSLNGVRIKDANMLFDSIGKLTLGENVKIGLVRNDKVFEVEAIITSFGEVNAQNGNQLNQTPTE